MSDATGSPQALNPAMIVLAVLLLGGLLFWMFLCTQPADNRVLQDDAETGVTESVE